MWQTHLRRRLSSVTVFEGRRVRDRPLSTFHEPGEALSSELDSSPSSPRTLDLLPPLRGAGWEASVSERRLEDEASRRSSTWDMI